MEACEGETTLKAENEAPKRETAVIAPVNPEADEPKASEQSRIDGAEGVPVEEAKAEVPKSLVVCAISEAELNKVDLAYFKRPFPPMSNLILSDK